MIKKTITFEDLEGNEITEDFFFHLSKAELVEFETSKDGGLSKAMQRIIASNDNAQIIAIFKSLILLSYGEKSSDGRRFIKSEEMREAFSQTDAYSTLFMELATDAGKASAFVKGIIPSSLAKEVETVEETSGEKPMSELTKEELLERLKGISKD